MTNTVNLNAFHISRCQTFVEYMNYQCFLYQQKQEKFKLLQEKLKIQKRIKTLFSQVSGLSLLLSSYFSNPLNGALTWSVISLLERTNLLEIASGNLFQWWNELDIKVRRHVMFTTPAITAVATILLFSYIIPRNESRGGVDIILPKTTRLVGNGFNLEVAADFCKVVYDYSQRNPFSPNFRIPQREIWLTLLTEVIFLINQKIMAAEPINFLNPMLTYKLLMICDKQPT